jgi:thioredoxin-like negative regulator of GroEL
MSGSSTQARSAAELAPRLVFFDSPTSGRCRRVEGFLAQVLQHRRNHDSFKLVRVSVDERPDLAERFGIERLPTLCVVDDGRLTKRIPEPQGPAICSGSFRAGFNDHRRSVSLRRRG